jgi:hypothetical protein
MIIKCAWCGKILGEQEGTGISHGICEDCERRLREEHRVTRRARRNATWDVGERVQFRRTRRTRTLPAHRHLNAGIGSAIWKGAKSGYYSYRASRLESKAKRYREKAAANPRTIPGTALEIRYRRNTDGKLYYHPFEGPVTMKANRDGSVTLRGRKRIWADDREPGFWERYGHGRGKRRNPVARRRRGGDNTMLWLIGGAALLFFWNRPAQAVSTGGQPIIPQPSNSVWYSDPYQGGGGEFFTGMLPPGASPPWRLASATEIGNMEAGLISGYLADAGGGLVAPAPGFFT